MTLWTKPPPGLAPQPPPRLTSIDWAQERRRLTRSSAPGRSKQSRREVRRTFRRTFCVMVRTRPWRPGSLASHGSRDHLLSVRRGPSLSRIARRGPTPRSAPAQKADVEAMRAAQSPSIKDAIELGNAKPGLDAAKTEISGGDREASGKAERPRSKSAERLSKSSERLDRIGLEIAALLAAAPAADPSAAVAPVARRPAQNARHDAFDPLQNPTAPGAPRPLGTIARAATVANSAENEYGHRAN